MIHGGVRATLLVVGVAVWLTWLTRCLAEGLVWVAEILAILTVRPVNR